MAKPIEQLVVEANQRLKAGRTGLVIELRKNSLCLRGTLPPKPDSDRYSSPHQKLLIDNHSRVLIAAQSYGCTVPLHLSCFSS